MSKIFNRPMFRKGGEVGGGIMTGVMRDNFDVGGSAKERLLRVAQEYPSQGMDPLTQFLIQGGLNLASQPATGGGIIADIATAAKEPTAQLMTGLSKKGDFNRELALAGEQLDIETERDLAIAREKNKQKDFFAAQTPEEQFKTLFAGYSESSVPVIKSGAFNLAKFEVKAKQLGKDYTQLGFEYDNKAKGYVPRWDAVPVGAITYNPKTNLAYQRISRDTDTAQDYIPLNPNNFQPLE